MKKDTRQRFYEKVRLGAGCHIWTGARDTRGYGNFWIAGKWWKAPRAAWMLEFGAPPNDLVVMHTCDNPPCVNTDHLRLGTQKENCQDTIRKRRHPVICNQSGEKNHRAKLTWELVRAIRHWDWPHSQEELGNIFGVSKSLIGKIKKGQIWRE